MWNITQRKQYNLVFTVFDVGFMIQKPLINKNRIELEFENWTLESQSESSTSESYEMLDGEIDYSRATWSVHLWETECAGQTDLLQLFTSMYDSTL